MASLMNLARRAASAVLRTSNNVISSSLKSVTSPSQTLVSLARCSSSKANYDPYPKYEETPDPYTYRRKTRYGYDNKLHTGGVLPRPKGAYEDIPLPKARVFAQDRDAWKKEKALFGQNDYIDILGDGQVHPVQLMTGPAWLIGYKGNELQRIVRRMKFQGRLLKDKFPSKYTALNHRMWVLYKKLNRRKRKPYWGGVSTSRDRRFNLNKR